MSLGMPWRRNTMNRITSYNVCYTKLLRTSCKKSCRGTVRLGAKRADSLRSSTANDLGFFRQKLERLAHSTAMVCNWRSTCPFEISRQRRSCSPDKGKWQDPFYRKLRKKTSRDIIKIALGRTLILLHRITSYNVCYTKLLRRRCSR